MAANDEATRAAAKAQQALADKMAEEPVSKKAMDKLKPAEPLRRRAHKARERRSTSTTQARKLQ